MNIGKSKAGIPALLFCILGVLSFKALPCVVVVGVTLAFQLVVKVYKRLG